MRNRFGLIAMLTLLQGCVIHVNANETLQQRQQVLTLSAQDLQQLIAETGAGSLTIQGVSGLQQIEVQASIYDKADSDIELSLVRHNSAAILIAKFNDRINFGNSPYIDLVVKVPAKFGLKLEDGSGDMRISGLGGDLLIKDGSGTIDINGGRQLTLEDGSGDIQIRQISGSVNIDDGSGNIELQQVTGDVEITDGSGNIQIKEVTGNVKISDGSGDIDVQHAATLTVTEDGSGDIHYQNISGKVQISDRKQRE